jgi:hypothetical protein
MTSVLRYWLKWPSVETFMSQPWAWPMCETFHFIGLCLLVGIVGTYDLRMLGVGKGLPLGHLKRLLPWGVFGFVLCLVTGALFVAGMGANIVGANAYDVIAANIYLQLKLLFIALAGVNLSAFYLTGLARRTDGLGPADKVPPLARIIAAVSLFLWLGVVVLGRLIPREL